MGHWYDPWGVASDIYHAVTGAPTASQRRDAQRLMNEQMKAYRQQTEITRQEIARKRDSEAVEKRRVEEKQIRSLRRNYRSQSLMGTADMGQADMSPK